MEDVTNSNKRKTVKAKPKRTKQKNDHFKLKVKVKAINHYEKINNFSLTATTFGTSRINIMNRYKNKDAILDSYNQTGRFRVRSKNDRAMYKDMEAELVKIIKTMRENGGIVSGLYIKIKALKYMQDNHPRTSFKASDGWLRNFNNRNGFTLRRVTTTGREMPEDTLEILKKHLDECEQLLTGI